MNNRQKKKLYKKFAENNPPKWMKYSGMIYHTVISKPWGGEKEYQRRKIIRRLENFNNVMTKRRCLRKSICRKGRNGHAR